MLRTLRRVFGWSVKRGFTLVAIFLVLGFGLSLIKPTPVHADERVDSLQALALSDIGLNQRLAVVDQLKGIGRAAARDALIAIAKTGDLPIQAAACAALGRMKTSGTKDDLKTLLEDTKLSDEVRLSAATCIAVHWKDSGDLSYLEDQMQSRDALKDQFSYLKTQVYGVR